MEKDAEFFLQVVKSMDDLESKLEESYKKGDVENFNKARGAMARMQKKISEMIDDI
ncbi:hypothetical protein HY449_04515 [Candidatus Pacearchaeota archaeon]|nr:hypothetical protein [Candidatus Pacearchaeota archaeon]